MIGEGVLVAAIAAGGALAGSALSYWGAQRLQARQDARTDALARALHANGFDLVGGVVAQAGRIHEAEA